MYTVARIIGATLLAFLLTALIERGAAELFVHWYMDQHGVSVRADLSEDYGFGMTGLALSVGVCLLAFPFCFAIAGNVLALVASRLRVRRKT